jgi:hypothetical protein
MITYPDNFYWLAACIALLALAGLVKNLRAARRAFESGTPTSSSSPQPPWLTPTFELWSLHVITTLGVAGALLLYAVTVAPGLPGRYMFPAFPSLALLLAAGLLAWFPSRWHLPAGIVILSLELAVTLYGLFGLLLPTYRLPRTPSRAELNQMQPLGDEVGDVAQVLGYRLSTDMVKGSSYLDVTIYWLPRAKSDIPYTVFIHLYNPERGSLAQRDTYPGQGNYATTVWDPGRPFADTYRLRLPPDTPEVRDAQILLGLYDQQTMQRLPVTGAHAGSADEAWVQFGDIAVQP